MQANYGSHDPAAVAAVKRLYSKLGLEELFKAYEDDSYAALTAMIDATSTEMGVPSEVYLSLLHKIYKRQK